MATGFGKTTTNRKSIIKSLSTAYIADPQYLSQQRRDWHDEYSERNYEHFSEEQLFKKNDYTYSGPQTLKNSFKPNRNSSTYRFRTHQRQHQVLLSGFWGLLVTHDQRGQKSKHFQEWDFSFNVKCGPNMIFHPYAARRHIVRHHGIKTFYQWREAVVDDLQNFKKVMKSYNPPAHMISATCCSSSERVCKRLDLDIRNGFAYLLHRKGEPCLHANGEFDHSHNRLHC